MKINPHTRQAILNDLKQDYRKIALTFEQQAIANLGKTSPDIKGQVKRFITDQLRTAQEHAKRVIPQDGNTQQAFTLEWFEHACHNTDTNGELKARMDVWKSYQRTCVMAEEDSIQEIFGDLTLALNL